MKQLISITILLLSYQFLFAQYESFDLSKYKLPDIKRHQLDFSLLYNNQYSENSSGSFPDFSNFKLNNDINGAYSYYMNSDKLQMEGLVNLSTTINIDKQKTGDVAYNKNSYSDYDLNASLDRRMYFDGEDKWFFLWSPNLWVRRYSNYVKETSGNNDENIIKNLSRDINFHPGMNLGGGFGRIEPVGDLRRAIYILEDLFKNDRLTRLPNENEVLQLADKVAKLRNQRFFDSRLRNIYEIKSLDSLLNNLGLINEKDAVYFTSLNDMWFNANESRYTGTRIQFYILGKLLYDFNKTRTENYVPNSERIVTKNNIKHFNEQLGIQLSLESYKPIGLKWQRNFSTNLNFYRYYPDVNTYSLASNYNAIVGSVQYRYDWFMNTRTNASFGVSGLFGRYDYSNVNESLHDYNYVNFSLNGKLNYYFSSRLRASLSMGLAYSWNENEI